MSAAVSAALAGAILISLPDPSQRVLTSTTAEAALIEAIVSGRGELPSLAEVQRAAEDALSLADDETARSWSSRARWRGIVPKLDAAIGSDADIDIRDSWQGELERTTSSGRAFGVQVGARWELGELVFSDSELRASRERLARASAIHLARDRATKLYFERVEVLLLLRAQPTRELVLAAARLDGLLRAITGGLLATARKD